MKRHKLIIQIPCFNEEAALPAALADLPRTLVGFDIVEWLVIDDGSTDRTAEVARAHGVHHVVRFTKNQGLAKGFISGLERALQEGADVIVNTDADNQYHAGDIPKLVAPILRGEADFVIGARPISEIEHFSFSKKILQKVGSWVVGVISGTSVRDAPSGFRAISREAAMKLHVFTRYSYTLETLIQAGRNGMAVQSVPVRVNGPIRPSRLIRSLWSYLFHSGATILRIFILYKPLAIFSFFGTLVFALGFALGLRFLYFYFGGGGEGNVQSLILAALSMGVGALLIIIGVIADLISVNRKLLERVHWEIQRKT